MNIKIEKSNTNDNHYSKINISVIKNDAPIGCRILTVSESSKMDDEKFSYIFYNKFIGDKTLSLYVGPQYSAEIMQPDENNNFIVNIENSHLIHPEPLSGFYGTSFRKNPIDKPYMCPYDAYLTASDGLLTNKVYVPSGTTVYFKFKPGISFATEYTDSGLEVTLTNMSDRVSFDSVVDSNVSEIIKFDQTNIVLDAMKNIDKLVDKWKQEL